MTKILLVEDDKSLREIYGVRLLAEGYDIVSAGDGEEALAMAIKDRPALIVSDVMMPKISGFDMLDILRSTTETKDIKVIMMTALSSEDQRKRGEQLGADRYLVKSQVGIEDVVRAVHEVLGDAPVSSPSFSSAPTAAPSAPPAAPAPRPPAPAVPPRPVTPAPTPAPSAPAAPQPSIQPTAPRPAAPAAPSVNLPQPTAPFSTPRPGSLADRVIEPLSKPDTGMPPVAELMEKELSGPQANPFAETPKPPTLPTPTPTAPQPSPPISSSGLQFEETARPITPTPPPSAPTVPPVGPPAAS